MNKKKNKNKEELKKKIDEKVNLIKSNSKDAHYAEALIDELLSLKGQYDVEPMLVGIPLTGKEVSINERGAYTITKNEFATVFHTNGINHVLGKDGHYVTISNTLRSAHCPFDKLFELYEKKQNKTITEEEEELYGLYLEVVICAYQLPTFAANKEHWQAMLVVLMREWMQELSKDLNAELEPETPEENAEFEKNTKALNELLGEEEEKDA